jgi:YhcH/YjgK/YiaL family protein
MLFESLANADRHTELPAAVLEAIAYLKRTDFSKLTEGRHEVEGDRIFAIVQKLDAKPQSAAKWEAHRKYIDVQYVLEGVERMGWREFFEGMPIETPYDETKDFMLYATDGKFFDVPAGSLAVFFPKDVHAPCLSAIDTPTHVRKVIMKCRVEE